MKLKKILFSTESFGSIQNFGLFFMRLFVGGFMLTHGIPKLLGFSMMAKHFPDVIGIGSAPSAALMVFAEFFCSILIILGLFSRWACIPPIIGMLVAVLVAHANDPFMAKELPMFYLFSYLTLLLLGPGKFSLDWLIAGKEKG